MALSKRVRFLVLQRDQFTCQYCGNRAPNVELEVDHVHPVMEGGVDSLINLVTACFDCNRGKSYKQLSAVPKAGAWAPTEPDPLELPPPQSIKSDPFAVRGSFIQTGELTNDQFHILELIADAESRIFHTVLWRNDIESAVGYHEFLRYADNEDLAREGEYGASA